LSFDLIAGGGPVETEWPSAVDFDPFDMCPRYGGGLWVLDRTHKRLWELDGTLSVVSSGQPLQPVAPAVVADFQPLTGHARELPPRQFPSGLDLAAAPILMSEPIAIESLGEAGVLVLDCDPAAMRSRVVRLRRTADAWQASAQWLTQLHELAHDMVYAAAPRLDQPSAPRLFISSATGNQVHAFEVIDNDDEWKLQQPAELYPLRRYGGRALINVQCQAHYDSGLAQPSWTPVVMQPRQRYAPQAEFVTPVFDSAELGTTWDRVLLDASIPPDTEIQIESRAGDERNDLLEEADPIQPEAPQVIGIWQPEPSPQLRSTGVELPWLRLEAARATRREVGTGTWELLLQSAQGRYLQLRIRLTSLNGKTTPRLRALRVWYPRFSYTQRFLPSVYSEDPSNGPFLERWLANFESTLTQIEDRLVNVQSLFDARTVPGDVLPWLAQWFDLALDPSWDERRHRLLVRHAMDFFRWRGTVHGIRLALELAFDPRFDAKMFDGPSGQDDAAHRIRIVEAYQTRRVQTLVTDVAARSATAFDGPRVVQQQALWVPNEGNAGLVERLAQSQGRTATAAEQMTPFELVPPADLASQSQWQAFCSETLGFVPSVGAEERSRWQGYLVASYVSCDEMNRQHNTNYAHFDKVALPLDLPSNAKLAADWETFCNRRDGLRVRTLWADFLARRYRRIERLQRTYRCAWPRFEVVPLPDRLPYSADAQTDWLQFERHLLAIHRSAHQFSVLLPVSSVVADAYQLEDRLGLARRIVELEKPAHTVFDVRFYWAFNRVGEARLGLDTQLGAGSRAVELIPNAVVGQAYIGASFVGGPARQHGRDRLSLDC
jgi:phage tail-like protein